MIHIQSNMLKTLIEILTDATEENVSRFVKKHEFSEEVVSTWLLQKSFKGDGQKGYLLREMVQHGRLSIIPVVRCLCVGAKSFFFLTDYILCNARKTFPFYIILFPTLFSQFLALFFFPLPLTPLIPSPQSSLSDDDLAFCFSVCACVCACVCGSNQKIAASALTAFFLLSLYAQSSLLKPW